MDATGLGVATLYVDGVAYDATAPFSARLLPGQHTVYTTGEDPNTFTINGDGTVSYDASLEGVFTGAGTTMLGIVGRTVSVDATELQRSGFYLDDVAHDPDQAVLGSISCRVCTVSSLRARILMSLQ